MLLNIDTTKLSKEGTPLTSKELVVNPSLFLPLSGNVIAQRTKMVLQEIVPQHDIIFQYCDTCNIETHQHKQDNCSIIVCRKCSYGYAVL